MQTTIYIRKENEEFWESLGKDRSAWVNEQISGEETKTFPPPIRKPKPAKEIPDFNYLEDTRSPVKAFKVKNCKQHGTPLTLEGKCLQKGH